MKNDRKLQQQIFQVKKQEKEKFRRKELFESPSAGENMLLGLEAQDSKDLPAESNENSPEQPSSVTAADPLNEEKIKQKAKIDELNQTIETHIKHLTKDLNKMYATDKKQRQFSFQNQQISNSPYHLVKKYPEQQIVRQSEFNNQHRRPQECI